MFRALEAICLASYVTYSTSRVLHQNHGYIA